MAQSNLLDVDWSKIPAPIDDGAAAHLTGLEVPPISLVATNDKELNELIRRGERNIVKFNITKKTKGYQKVGDIGLMLKNVDPKKNKFTLEVNADDKLTEKKDRNINEPLQFYVSNSLYELVVNTVAKDTVSGYLSTPKYGNTRNN